MTPDSVTSGDDSRIDAGRDIDSKSVEIVFKGW